MDCFLSRVIVQTDDSIAGLAKALAHPARIRILRLLQATPGCIGGDIVDAVSVLRSRRSPNICAS
jgi:ArsR family transcriptional regulator, arsenate/arsenite/antimonite-responsive transcriptional repressor